MKIPKVGDKIIITGSIDEYFLENYYIVGKHATIIGILDNLDESEKQYSVKIFGDSATYFIMDGEFKILLTDEGIKCRKK